jgi:tape measure domain-containing protein
MTTITALNVRLGMDVSNFSEGANLAKGEVTKVASIMRQSVPPAEKFKQEVDLLNRAFSEAGKKSREYANALAFLENKHKQTASAIAKTTDATNKANSSASGVSDALIGSLKGAAAAYLSLQTVAKAINLASEIEDATVAFEVLTGSAQNGKILFEQIRKLDQNTPITFSNATQAAKTMLSFGVAVQDIEGNLKLLSDVTGGNNERFKNLALAFSQTSAAGRLMGQDVLQMINAGFNPLQQISKTTGESMIELKKRMEDGGISAQEVRQAFVDATSEGGMFHGMTERLAETVSGKLNIALSDMEQKLAAAGEALGPLIIQLLDASKDMAPLLEDAITLIGLFAKGMGFVVALTQDYENMKKGKLGFENTNAFLDRLEERERKLEADKAAAVNAEFEQKEAAVNHVAIAERKAAEQLAAARAKHMEDQKKAAEDAIKQQQKNIEKEKAARLKAIEDAKKAQERAAQQAEEQFQRDMETARKAAMDYFAQQEEKNKQRRADVAAGPGAGMEVGSAEAAKFSADQINRQISVTAVPDQPTPGEAQIAWKAEQLFKEQQAANALATRQIAIMDSLLREAKENGFRRIR